METKPKTISNLTRKTFLCTEKQIEIIKVLKDKFGIKTETGVFDMAIQALYEKTFKYGEDPLTNSTNSDSPESILKKAKAKAQAKVALKQAEEQAKIQPKIDMCLNLLGGEIETNENGFQFCRFTTFGTSPEKDKSQMIPIKQVDPIIAETSLFFPDREIVYKHRPEVKELFDRLN